MVRYIDKPNINKYNKEDPRWEMQEICNNVKKQNHENYKTHSKKRLMEQIKKKFQTTMIGALDKFEQKFGYLWGMGKNPNTHTAQEAQYAEMWEYVRTEILNNGNTQCRACLDDISEYTMTWNRYNTKFIVHKDQSQEKGT